MRSGAPLPGRRSPSRQRLRQTQLLVVLASTCRYERKLAKMVLCVLSVGWTRRSRRGNDASGWRRPVLKEAQLSAGGQKLLSLQDISVVTGDNALIRVSNVPMAAGGADK